MVDVARIDVRARVEQEVRDRANAIAGRFPRVLYAVKAFTAHAARLIFSRQTLSGFGFDLECLFIARLHGLKITEVPVDFYYNSEPSTISFIRHGTQMLADLVRVRQNGRRGLYA